MLNESARKQDFPAPLTAEAHPRMPWRVMEAVPLQGFRLAVRFLDGTSGTVDMSELIHSPHAGVFSPLADPALFAQLFVESGTVTWPGDLDLAPDAMYAEIKRRGEWKLK